MIIAAFNPNGGVGKTTTAVNLASVIAASGTSTLIVDLEWDMNASISLGVKPGASPSVSDVLLNRARPFDAIRRVQGIDNLHVMPGSQALAGMDAALRHVRQPERRLADALKPLTGKFDTIVIDPPPGFSTLALSVPVAATQLIVPVRADYLSLESLARFLSWYRDRLDTRQAQAPVAGVLLTMVDYRRPATSEIVDIIRRHNRQGVFRTEIPADPRVPEAPSHGTPLVRYAPRSRASDAYRALAAEMRKRHRTAAS